MTTKNLVLVKSW